MDPEPEDYDVEIVDTRDDAGDERDAETGNIRKEGDPIGDNFA